MVLKIDLKRPTIGYGEVLFFTVYNELVFYNGGLLGLKHVWSPLR